MSDPATGSTRNCLLRWLYLICKHFLRHSVNNCTLQVRTLSNINSFHNQLKALIKYDVFTLITCKVSWHVLQLMKNASYFFLSLKGSAVKKMIKINFWKKKNYSCKIFHDNRWQLNTWETVLVEYQSFETSIPLVDSLHEKTVIIYNVIWNMYLHTLNILHSKWHIYTQKSISWQ